MKRKRTKLEPVWVEFARQVREKRQARAMTQKMLADEVDVDRTTITFLETGKQRLRLEKLIRLAKFLEIDILSLA